jgi:2-dehydropantoate 2-reductase
LEGPRILVHGAGSIGCYVGGVWAAAGLDVAFVGREAVRREIAGNGMTLTDSEGGRIALRPDEVRFSTSPDALAQADIIALCVKSTGTAAAAREIAHHAREDAIVISFQNGISNADVLKEALPGMTILRGMIPFNVIALGNGRWHKAVAVWPCVEDHPATRALAARIGKRPGRLRLSSDMAGILWGKLLINLNNAVNALSGKTLIEQLGDRDYRRVVAASQIEALEILDAAGIVPAKAGPIAPRLMPHVLGAPDFLFRPLVLKRWKFDAKGRSSMADDFTAGRPTEIDYLNGEVVRLARSLGREAPVNEAITALVRQAEAGVERMWSAAELRAHVLKRHRGAAGFGY